MSLRRSATAAFLIMLALTSCGPQRAGQAGQVESARRVESTAPSSFTPRPKCAQPTHVPTAAPSSPAPEVSGEPRGENEDRPPHYAENHAYRMQAPLTAEKRAQGEASARLILEELEKVRREGGAGEYGVYSDERIVEGLSRLGCGPEHGVHVGSGAYSVHTGVVCVSGRVTRDELTGEVHGAYAEPQPGAGPCVENRGGH
ncbi:hypothetical protein N566_22465 [Streptomycetaceae bacterium MP113-05]|nr:hypothetical protein N566_22465 [Streptomycetaceae bacterium MP113-05]